MRYVDTLINHHSASKPTITVEEIRKEHLARGFKDIGYHFIIHQDPYSRVWLISKGRDLAVIGSHDEGQNTGSIGICAAGNYEENPIPILLWETWVNLNVMLWKQFPAITIQRIQGHHEHEPPTTPTACPGKHMDLERFRLAIASKMRV